MCYNAFILHQFFDLGVRKVNPHGDETLVSKTSSNYYLEMKPMFLSVGKNNFRIQQGK